MELKFLTDTIHHRVFTNGRLECFLYVILLHVSESRGVSL